jgi:hypothetical protein
VSGQLHGHPLARRLSGPQSRSGRRGENSWPYRDSNSDLSVVQPIASRYTDCAILAPAPPEYYHLSQFESVQYLKRKSIFQIFLWYSRHSCAKYFMKLKYSKPTIHVYTRWQREKPHGLNLVRDPDFTPVCYLNNTSVLVCTILKIHHIWVCLK